MDAQGAIADIEDRLRLLTKYAVRDYERQEIEALSIVLESAKYFHQQLMHDPLVQKYEDGDIIVYLETEFNEVIKLSPEKAAALRIEVTE